MYSHLRICNAIPHSWAFRTDLTYTEDKFHHNGYAIGLKRGIPTACRISNQRRSSSFFYSMIYFILRLYYIIKYIKIKLKKFKILN